MLKNSIEALPEEWQLLKQKWAFSSLTKNAKISATQILIFYFEVWQHFAYSQKISILQWILTKTAGLNNNFS